MLLLFCFLLFFFLPDIYFFAIREKIHSLLHVMGVDVIFIF